jgi:lipoprotein-anchoring transpeptidase ErfK/SrfK
MRTNTLPRARLAAAIAVIACLLLLPPAAAAQGQVHIVQPGETLSSIAARYGTSIQAFVQANGLSNPNFVWVGQRLTIPGSGAPAASGGGVHVVQRGETLYSIARRYGTTASALAAANGLRNANLIYVGQRLRISGSAASSGGSPPPATGGARWIDVDLSEQRVRAYEGSTVLRSMLVSTGTAYYPTPTGRFRIYAKYGAVRMTGPGYDLPNVPHTMYFYGGYAIHGTYWHNNFGHPMSHGCINLTRADAAWLYSFAPVGTLVVIHG